jgi:hypothetical protein
VDTAKLVAFLREGATPSFDVPWPQSHGIMGCELWLLMSPVLRKNPVFLKRSRGRLGEDVYQLQGKHYQSLLPPHQYSSVRMCDAYSRTFVLKAKNGTPLNLGRYVRDFKNTWRKVRTCRIHYGDSSRTVCRTSIDLLTTLAHTNFGGDLTWGSDEKSSGFKAKRIQ